ncbi:MAG: oligopeptide transporter, permease protein [Actinomycetia bacterium]|nr:oligopeptide transporter, permease protein [Actinomycetes bacterium]
MMAVLDEPAVLVRPRVPRRAPAVLRRLVRSSGAVVGLVLLALLFLLAFAGPFLSRWSWETTDFTAFREPPSATHWFGTTQSGRDVFAVTLRGMQKSLLIGLFVAVISTGLAALVGSFAGYLGGWADRILMWCVDLLLVLPSFLVIAVVSPSLAQGGWPVFIGLLAAFMWMVTARVVRGMTLSLKDQEYVLAARYMGVTTPRIILRHILPNLASLLIIDATLNVSIAIIAESALSYFGFGVQPPDSSLGTVIADGAGAATTYPWLFVPAAVLLVLIVLSVNLVGDGLRDALDPTTIT